MSDYLDKDWFDRAREMMGITQPKTLKELCYQVTGLSTEDGYTLQEIIHQATNGIFNFQYPLFAESYREALEAKIIKHYLYRQICCEDFTEWQIRLDARMNEIMPYFNKVYQSFDYLVDILDDVDYERVFQEMTGRTGNENTRSTQNMQSTSDNSNIGTSESTSSDERENIDRFSDTPQNQLTGLLNDTYMSSAQRTTNESSSTDKTSDTRTGHTAGKSDTEGTFDTNKNESGHRNYTEKVKGKMYAGSKPKIILEYRKALINVDTQVIDSLKDLFINLYTPYMGV